MQQVSAGSGLQGSQVQGSVSSQSTRSAGDPQPSSRVTTSRPKKRERNDASSESVKQQRIDKIRKCGEERESTWKPEASSLVGKDGGISSVAAVDRLVYIMQYEWNDSADRQLDLLMSRTMLSKVVATTADTDCLVKFLKLGGLTIFDKWLQEAYRGRHFASKEISMNVEKAVEDLLLSLLGALEKLPVDLMALKTCHVGKSVNLLRSHKHPDIQRKSKKLVDVWKKRVEAEMKQSGEGRLTVDGGLSIQHQEVGMMASKPQQGFYPATQENSIAGRGKFASVASLCSSPEGQLKVVSNAMPFSSVTEGSADLTNRSNLTSPLPTSSYNGVLPESPLALPCSSSPSSEDGIAKSTLDLSSNMAFAQVSSNQVRAVKCSAATRCRKSVNINCSKTSSVAAALSASMAASKGSSTSGSKELQGVASHSVAPVPCSSSSLKTSPNSLLYEGSSRSPLNSLSSSATDCNKKPTAQLYISAEPLKTGVQPLVNVAVSESSMVDVRGPDSPPYRSVSMQRVVTAQMESSAPQEPSMKCFNQSLLKAATRLDGENYDQISSTVSSPSETSAHVDVRMYESKRTPPMCSNAPSPHDTTSDTRFPSSIMRNDGNQKGGSVACAQIEQERVQTVSVNIKRVYLQPAPVSEAVGESSTVDKAEGKDIVNSTLKGVTERSTLYPERSTLYAGVQGRDSPSKYDDDVPLAARQFAGDVQQQVGLSRRGSTESISPMSADVIMSGNFTGARAQDTMLKVTLKPQVIDSTKDVQERPDLDLNKMLCSDEGAVQVPASSSTIVSQETSVPAPASKPVLPIVPMAPIAVVAAAKGSFTLPSVSYLPRAELGWKGSAATSAFRPTQPRHNGQKPSGSPSEQGANGKTALDFDLNVAADAGFVDHDGGLNSSSFALTLPARQGISMPSVGGLDLSQKSDGPLGAVLDLNQVDEDESQVRPVFDLNTGPMVQDIDDVVLSGKHHAVRAPLMTDGSSADTVKKLPSHSLNSTTTPIMMPAFTMANSEFPYSVSASTPWLTSGPLDGTFQCNLVMQNQPGLICPSLQSMQAGTYGGIPYGFSPPMQGFSAPFVEALRGSHVGSSSPINGEQPLLSSQSKTPPYLRGILAESNQHQGNGGFWSRLNLDLNSGPDSIDIKNVKDDRRQMLVMNDQMRARQQAMDIAAMRQQREQEGGLSMPGSMQGALLKQSVWR